MSNIGKSVVEAVKNEIKGMHNKAVYDKDVHIQRLEAVIEALSSRIIYLNQRKMERVNKTAEKWRNKCYYLEKKVDKLESAMSSMKGEGDEENS